MTVIWERTFPKLFHNHIIIIMNDLMVFIKNTSGFSQGTTSAVAHQCLTDREKITIWNITFLFLDAVGGEFFSPQYCFPSSTQPVHLYLNALNHFEQENPRPDQEWKAVNGTLWGVETWAGLKNIHRSIHCPSVVHTNQKQIFICGSAEFWNLRIIL